MVKRFFVGDKVRTKRGIGLVREVRTWRDVLVELRDHEVPDFCSRCKLDVGINFKDDWIELMVEIGNIIIKTQAKNVELVEGRDGTYSESSMGIGAFEKGE